VPVHIRERLPVNDWKLVMFWFSVKMRPSSGRRREIPPCGRGFSRHEDLNDPMVFYWAA
jgi:hypothetical protein